MDDSPGDGWVTRLRGGLVTLMLRRRLRVNTARRAFVRIFAIECSPDELDQLDRIDGTQITELGNLVRYWLGMLRPLPYVRALWFGRAARRDLAPRRIRQFLSAMPRCGAWAHDIRAIIIPPLPGGASPGGLLIHEVTHALLDLLTAHFPYPRGISEGFAEYMVSSVGVRTYDGRAEGYSLNWQKPGRGSMDDPPFMSIRDILTFDAREHWGLDPDAFTRMTWASSWLYAYLLARGRQRPRLPWILRELRLKNVTGPEAVYCWLQEASGMEANALEDDFTRYCRLGARRGSQDAEGGGAETQTS
jgi:hypothetical protein